MLFPFQRTVTSIEGSGSFSYIFNYIGLEDSFLSKTSSRNLNSSLIQRFLKRRKSNKWMFWDQYFSSQLVCSRKVSSLLPISVNLFIWHGRWHNFFEYIFYRISTASLNNFQLKHLSSRKHNLICTLIYSHIILKFHSLA